jgi:hypothetical protein
MELKWLSYRLDVRKNLVKFLGGTEILFLHSVHSNCGVHPPSIQNILAACACARARAHTHTNTHNPTHHTHPHTHTHTHHTPHTHTHTCSEVARLWKQPLTFSFRLNMYQATSTPSQIFTKQHLITHRDFTLTFSETGTGQDFCSLAVYLMLRFILLLADRSTRPNLCKHAQKKLLERNILKNLLIKFIGKLSAV